jgi:hypothetical protein
MYIPHIYIYNYIAGWTIQDSIPSGAKRCSLLHNFQTCSDLHDIPSLGGKQPEPEADNLPPYSVEVKNQYSYTCTPVLCLRRANRDGLHFTNIQHFCQSRYYKVDHAVSYLTYAVATTYFLWGNSPTRA